MISFKKRRHDHSSKNTRVCVYFRRIKSNAFKQYGKKYYDLIIIDSPTLVRSFWSSRILFLRIFYFFFFFYNHRIISIAVSWSTSRSRNFSVYTNSTKKKKNYGKAHQTLSYSVPQQFFLCSSFFFSRCTYFNTYIFTCTQEDFFQKAFNQKIIIIIFMRAMGTTIRQQTPPMWTRFIYFFSFP